MHRYIFLTISTFLIATHIIGQEDTSLLKSLNPHSKSELSDLNEFIDSLVLVKMEEYHVPGTSLAIIQDGRKIYTKGYGFADLSNGREVNADLTGFRIASVTKTLTATAVMQLVEKGLLDLHTPIDEYLPDRNFSFLGDQSITMHHLLTHTAGFDLTDTGDAALKSEDVIPIERLVRYHMPSIVHPPGTVYSYSNFGYTLAGYIIQVISGIPYEEFISRNILIPLKMNNSNMSQPLSAPFADNLSKSYRWTDRQIEIQRDFTNTVPGGGLISTASDMSRYMQFHLNQGMLDSVRLLNKSNHQILTTQQYGSEGTKYGICYAFHENGWTGRRCLEHTGGQLGFLTLMTLIPETKTGIFITHNSRENAGAFRYDLARAIFDTLLFRKERYINLPASDNFTEKEAIKYEGNYIQLNRPHSTFEKIGTLFGFAAQTSTVRYAKNGKLLIDGNEYVKLNERVFHENDEKGTWNVAFKLDENGVAEQLVAGLTSYKRIKWYEATILHQIILGFSFFLLLINFLKRPLAKLTELSKGRVTRQRRVPLLSKWIYWTGTLFVLGFFGILLNSMIYQGQLSDYGVPISLKIPFVLNTIGGILSLYAPTALYQLWQSKAEKQSSIVWKAILVISIILVAIGFWHYHIIGFWY